MGEKEISDYLTFLAVKTLSYIPKGFFFAVAFTYEPGSDGTQKIKLLIKRSVLYQALFRGLFSLFSNPPKTLAIPDIHHTLSP